MSLGGFRRSTNVLALCKRDGTIVDSSRPPLVVGLLLGELVPDAQRLAVEAALLRAEAKPRVDVTLDGAWYQLEVTLADDDLLSVVATDLTERRAVEERLDEVENLMTDTQNVAHLGVWEWQADAIYADWSPELYRIYGLTREVYQPTFDSYVNTLVHPDDRAAFKAATQLVMTKHLPFAHDLRVFHADGTLRYLRTWTRAYVDGQGKLERLIGVCQDMTDAKLAELEREHTLSLLRNSQKLEAVGRLTGGIAHDFNNILGIVIGYASMMYRRAAPDSPERGHVSEIIKAGERARRLTTQLLAFSRDTAIELSPIDLEGAVVDLVPLVQRLVGDKISVTCELAPDTVIEANASQLEQVIINLAANARDAMPDGGTLRITTRTEGERVILVVADSGTGMSEEVQAQIFDPFFTTKPVGKGTGLGLSTVYGIVKQGGGSITVKSTLGKGTAFEIEFPRIASTRPRIRPSAMNLTQRGNETILLVEDESALRDVVAHTLGSLGYNVLPASDAIAALRIAGDHVGEIHLVLTDVVMPRLSGRELVDQLKTKRPTMRVLYMSGYATDIMLREGIIEGTTELIRKPFHSEELARRLRMLLDP